MDQMEVIGKIESKVSLLAKKMDTLQTENERLQKANDKLKAELSIERNMLGKLKDKLKGTQLALDKQREGEPERIQALRARVEESLKEVDACIEWLQKA